MKRWISILAACAIAGALATGCSKGSDQNATAAASGPVTDEASSGMKPAETTGSTSAMGDADHGKAIFSQNCSSCHGVGGKGGGIGPTLTGEKSRKNFPQAVAWIKNPKPPMPKLYPDTLKESDVNDVAAYVESL